VADALSRTPFAENPEQCGSIMEETKENIGIKEMLWESIIACGISKKEEQERTATVKLKKKEKLQAKKWFELLDKMDSPIDTPFIEMAEMQAKDKSLEGCINKGVNDKEGKVWMIKDECLFHIRTNRKFKKKSLQLVVPSCLREKIMKAHHDDMLGGHCGYLKTLNKVSQWYWWPKMKRDVKEWVQTCMVCQTHSRNYGPKIGKLAPVTAQYPFQILGMDILGSLPTTKRGNRSIILFTDYYTKWVEAYAIPNEEAITIANKMIKGIICRHGAPILHHFR